MKFHTFIIPAGLLAEAKTKMDAAAGRATNPLRGLPGMFTVGLVAKNAANTAPVTAYISSGWLSDDESAYLKAQLPSSVFSDGTFTNPQGVSTAENGHGFLDRQNYKIRRPKVGALASVRRPRVTRKTI